MKQQMKDNKQLRLVGAKSEIARLLSAMTEVVEYSIEAERDDYEQDSSPDNHIYLRLRELETFIRKQGV